MMSWDRNLVCIFMLTYLCTFPNYFVFLIALDLYERDNIYILSMYEINGVTKDQFLKN